MILFDGFHEAECRPELLPQRTSIVPDHVEATALPRPVHSERTQDHMAAHLQRPSYLPHVGRSIGSMRKKVKHGAIMPDVVCARLQLGLRHIANQPANLSRPHTEPLPAAIHRGLRNVQRREVFVAAEKKIIHQRRLPRSDVDDRCRRLSEPLLR